MKAVKYGIGFTMSDSPESREFAETVSTMIIVENERINDMLNAVFLSGPYVVQRKKIGDGMRHILSSKKASVCRKLKTNEYRSTKLRELALPRCERCLERIKKC